MPEDLSLLAGAILSQWAAYYPHIVVVSRLKLRNILDEGILIVIREGTFRSENIFESDLSVWGWFDAVAGSVHADSLILVLIYI